MPDEATGKTGTPSPSRQKPERPRDHLGRPLPWGAASLLELPDFDAFSVAENHLHGLRLLREQNYFGAHEAWETAWKQSRGTGDEELFKGLSQMGAGYVHLRRGNRHGAFTLLRRGAGRIGSYPEGHLGISTRGLAERLEEDARRVVDGRLPVGEETTFAPPDV
jgi:hypothetical protein